MNNHLSQEQFAACFVGAASSPLGPSIEAQRHLAECTACREELERFGSTVSSLRSAIRNRVDGRAGRIQPSRGRMPRMRRAMGVAAVVLLGMVPLLTSQKPQQTTAEASPETTPDALMNAIHLHLSRTVASPMEPMMSLLPSDEFMVGSGGIQ